MYVRHDKDCKPTSPQPAHAIVSQKVSCIEYECFNKDYVRHDKDCKPAAKQPDIRNGWNGDFIRVAADGTQTTGLSKQFVEQTIYVKHDVAGHDMEFQCHVRRDNQNYVVPLTVREGRVFVDDKLVLLALQDDRDNVFVTEDGVYRIQLEEYTEIDRIVAENKLGGNRARLLQTEDDETSVVLEDGSVVQL